MVDFMNRINYQDHPATFYAWVKAFVWPNHPIKVLCKMTSILEPLQELLMIASRKKLKVLRK